MVCGSGSAAHARAIADIKPDQSEVYYTGYQVNETALSGLNTLEQRVFLDALGKVTIALSRSGDQ